MKKIHALLLSALVLCASRLPALAGASSPVLGILEIRGLDNLAASAFELSKAAGQPTPKEAISLLMYGALGTMPGMGLQPEGALRALWFDNGTDQGGTALLLPVENEGADFLAGLGQAGWKNEAETAEGIAHFSAPEGSGMAWGEVYFLKRGSTLVAGQTADDVRTADAAMSSLSPILPVEGDVAIQILPAALMNVFGPKIAAGMDQAFQASSGAPPEAAAMGELYVKGYIAVARQIDEFVLGLGVADGNLNIHTRVAPVAGSLLGQWFDTVGTPSAAAAVVNLPGALFAETANMGDLSLLAPAYFRYVEELLKVMPQAPSADFMKTYMETAKAYWPQMGGDFGLALLTPTKESPLRAAEYVSLKDSAAVRTLTRQIVQSANEMMKAMTLTNLPVPFTIELATGEPREYRGIPVDKVAYGLTLSAPLASNWPEGLPTKFDIEMAWVPGGMLISVGDAALTDTLVDRALDGGTAPVSDLPAWQALHPAPEKDLVDLSHIALFDTLRAYLGVVDSYTGGQNAAVIPAGPGNLESSSYKAMGGMMSRVRFSLADIAAIGQKVKEAQEKAMAAMMEQMQGEMQIEEPEDMEMEADDYESVDEADYEQWNAGADAEEAAGQTEEVEPPAAAGPEPVALPAEAPAPAAAE